MKDKIFEKMDGMIETIKNMTNDSMDFFPNHKPIEFFPAEAYDSFEEDGKTYNIKMMVFIKEA